MNGVGGAVVIFATFAFGYFFSALLRAVTATLAPVFSAELGLRAGDLGLLAGAYFFGFAALQLPLGRALDRFGPRRTAIALLAVGVAGCAAFALASSLPALIAARMLIGAGMAAGLMAPLTAYRRLFPPAAQLRANSWMLMTGSLGMVASTVPVQALLPLIGWRGLFWAVAAMLLAAAVLIALFVPRAVDAAPAVTEHDPADMAGAPAQSATAAADRGVAPAPSSSSTSTSTSTSRSVLTPAAKPSSTPIATPESTPESALSPAPPTTPSAAGYAAIVRHPLFMRLAPLGFVVYGGLIAVQSLWAGPWLTRVAGWSAAQAAQGLFTINLAMLVAFGFWGAVMPRLALRGITPLRLVGWGLPLSLLLLAGIVALGERAGAVHWALWCVACTFVSVSQPAVGAAFPSALAGRALSAFNLVIFAGVFCVQWGIGLAIDALRAAGLDESAAFRATFAAFGACCAAAYAWFLRPVDNRR